MKRKSTVFCGSFRRAVQMLDEPDEREEACTAGPDHAPEGIVPGDGHGGAARALFGAFRARQGADAQHFDSAKKEGQK